MKNKLILVFSILFITVLVLVSRDSFATPIVSQEEDINLTLLDNSDMEVLKEDMIYFIDLVDNNLIPNTSYNMSSKLNENYDFLTRFAISFILDNEWYYDIIYGDNYIYRDDYGREFSTNKYINIDTIYDITYQVFGVEYYYILNDYIEINNDLVPLLEIEEYDATMDIDSIVDINKGNNYYDVIVKYKDNDIGYVYRLELVDNRIVIGNLSIEE